MFNKTNYLKKRVITIKNTACTGVGGTIACAGVIVALPSYAMMKLGDEVMKLGGTNSGLFES